MNEHEIILYHLQMLIDWKTQSTFLSYKDMSAQMVSGNSRMMVAIFDAERMIRSNEI